MKEKPMDIEMRSRSVELTGVFCTQVQRRFSFALGRFESSIRRVVVRFADANGVRGGVDKRCKVAVYLQSSLAVFIEDMDADLDTVVDRVAQRSAQSVARALNRQRERCVRPLRLAAAIS
jgi:hypothetical protein